MWDVHSRPDGEVRYIDALDPEPTDVLWHAYIGSAKTIRCVTSKYVPKEKSNGGEASQGDAVTQLRLAMLRATDCAESTRTLEGVVLSGSGTKRASNRQCKPIKKDISDSKEGRGTPAVGWNQAMGIDAYSETDQLDSTAGAELEGERAPDESLSREIDTSNTSDPLNSSNLVTEIDELDVILNNCSKDMQYFEQLTNRGASRSITLPERTQ